LNSGPAQAGGLNPGVMPNLNMHLNIPLRPAAASGKKSHAIRLRLPRLPGQRKPPVCPKLVAGELHIVRTVSQPGDKYKFILDGTIFSRGGAGMATAGFNVTQGIQGRAGGKKIALKLFNQQVRPNGRLTIKRDFHTTVQSDALTRQQAGHTVFKLAVTNLRNGKGLCGEYNPTTATVTSAQVRRALPALSQRVGTIKKPRNFASSALSGSKRFGLNKPVTGPGGKPLLPPQASGGTRHVLSGGHAMLPGGFVPTQKPMFGSGSGRPITGRDGQSIIPTLQALPKMKLVIDHIGDGNGQRLGSVIPGNVVRVFFKIQYTGNTMYTVYVKGRSGEGRTENIILSGGNNPVLALPVLVRRDIPWTGDWNPTFMLHINSIVAGLPGYTRPGPSVHSRNQRDEMASVATRIHWRGDLEVVAIKRVTLNMQWGGAGLIPWFMHSGKPWNKWKGTGGNHPTSISIIVTVRNNDTNSSVLGRKLIVKLTGLSEYNPVRNNRHYPTDLSYQGDGCRSAGCSMQVRVSVPPMSGYGQKDVRVVLQRLPFRTWIDAQAGKRGAKKGYHRELNSGYYLCSRSSREPGSRIRIDATVEIARPQTIP